MWRVLQIFNCVGAITAFVINLIIFIKIKAK